MVDNVGDQVVDSGGSIDTILTTLNTYSLGIGSGIENLTFIGTGNFAGTGNELANAITGGAGNDTLDGGTGADTLTGGLGDDTYLVDNASDQVVEKPGEGIDTIITGLSVYTLVGKPDVENLTLTAVGGAFGTGNDLANVLTGGAGNDTLTGGKGNDTLIGGGGSDLAVFTGDLTQYRATWVGGNLVVADLVAGRDGTDSLAGIGRVNFGGTVFTVIPQGAPGDAAANLLAGTTGNDSLSGAGGNDVLYGDGGADTLDGGTGADTMIGGQNAGDSTIYMVDNTGDVVMAGAGTDTVVTTLSTYTLGLNIENLTYGGTGPSFLGTGNSGANLITGAAGTTTNNSLYGNAGNDTLIGGGAADVLYGGADNDSLSGGAGKDQLSGDAGNDTLDGGAGSDILTGGAGADDFIFWRGQTTGDAITDFTNGVDRIDFYGFAAGSTFVKAAGTATYSIWTVTDATTHVSESIMFTGVSSSTNITGYVFH